ncbi:hypothetical protein [Actinocrispum sp. NPDC049592]
MRPRSFWALISTVGGHLEVRELLHGPLRFTELRSVPDITFVTS